MGYYIETPEIHHKDQQIVKLHGGKIIPKPSSFDEIPADKALIVVVCNGPWDAAALIYSRNEFEEFTDITDTRHKSYVLMNKQLAYKLAQCPLSTN